MDSDHRGWDSDQLKTPFRRDAEGERYRLTRETTTIDRFISPRDTIPT